MAYRIKYFAPAVLYAILILLLSSMDQNTAHRYAADIEDYILHFVEYNLFGVTLTWAFFREKPMTELRYSYRLAVGVGTLAAMADEFYQSFIPSRYSTIEDVVADVFGLILSIITFTLVMKIPVLERFRTSA
ncbi:MAG: VanZ family protein [Candidatus Marinimicrobia bacterium]|nr:VanZ family protein [Candidatus Neomarinimicrobiota bacterium]